MPKVSVIIPTYQRSHLVGQAIESVLAQTYCDYEIIVVNDGSTDNTGEILAQYGDRIVAIHQENRGLPAARNAGIRVAQGQYLAFLDDDDLWEPQKLEKQIPLLEADSRLGLVYSDMVIFNEAGIQPGTYLNGFVPPQTVTPWTLLHRNFFPMPTIVIRRVCWEQLGGFDESLRSCEDYDLWLRIVEQWAVGYVNEPLTRYCRHSENSKQLSQNTETMLLTTLWVKEAAFHRNPYLQRLQLKYRDSCLRREYLELADFYTQNGDLAKAKAVLDRYQPANDLSPVYGSLPASLSNTSTLTNIQPNCTDMQAFDQLLPQKVAFADDILPHPVGRKSILFKLETGREFNLNETATGMLNLLLESASIEEAYNQLQIEYKIAPELLQKDLLALIEKLLTRKLIVITNSNQLQNEALVCVS